MSSDYFDLVEVRRVELLSDGFLCELSTSLVCLLGLVPIATANERQRAAGFVGTARVETVTRAVPT